MLLFRSFVLASCACMLAAASCQLEVVRRQHLALTFGKAISSHSASGVKRGTVCSYGDLPVASIILLESQVKLPGSGAQAIPARSASKSPVGREVF